MENTESEKKPLDGQFVAHCPHIKEKQVSWFWCEDTKFEMGEAAGKVDWLCVCVDCEKLTGGDVAKAVLSGVAVYQSLPVPTLVAPPAQA